MNIKRRFVRWQVNKEAKVLLEGALNPAICTVKEISFQGVQLCLKLKLPKDTFLKLRLILSEQFILDVECWVVWHKGIEGINIYGLYFTKIKDADKEKIYQFIRRDFAHELHKQWWQETPREKGGEKMEDRRIFQRFAAQLPLRFLKGSNGKEGRARTLDISAKGIGMMSAEELKPASPVELWMEIPEQAEPLYTRGQVVWSEPQPDGQYRNGVNLEKADLMGVSRVLRAA
jgi:c-di-GMP-binding flagellar brake protein YcgR